MRYFTLFLFASLTFLAVACGSTTPPAPTATPIPPTPTPSPQDWLDRAIGVWNGSENFHFTLELVGRTIPLDESGQLSFSDVEGDVVAPDRLQAQTLIKTPFGSTEVAFIAIGEEQWLTNPLSGEWEAAPPTMRTNVTEMFDPQVGIGSILADLEELERLPDESLDGQPTIHLRGTLPGALLQDFASDLPERVSVDLWLGTDDQRFHKLTITEPVSGAEAATWTFLFSNYNSDISIEPPL